MKDPKRNNSTDRTESLDSKVSSNPLDQFADVVYKTVDNMVDDDEQESQKQE